MTSHLPFNFNIQLRTVDACNFLNWKWNSLLVNNDYDSKGNITLMFQGNAIWNLESFQLIPTHLPFCVGICFIFYGVWHIALGLLLIWLMLSCPNHDHEFKTKVSILPNYKLSCWNGMEIRFLNVRLTMTTCIKVWILSLD